MLELPVLWFLHLSFQGGLELADLAKSVGSNSQESSCLHLPPRELQVCPALPFMWALRMEPSSHICVASSPEPSLQFQNYL